MLKWLHKKCRAKVDSLREAQLQAITRIRKETDKEKEQLRVLLRAVTAIRYERTPNNNISIITTIPIRDLMYRLEPREADEYLHYLAGQMGYLLEREMRQLNWVNLSRQLEETHYGPSPRPWLPKPNTFLG